MMHLMESYLSSKLSLAFQLGEIFSVLSNLIQNTILEKHQVFIAVFVFVWVMVFGVCPAQGTHF